MKLLKAIAPLLLVGAGTVLGQAGPDLSQVTIKRITPAGDGCRDGSYKGNVSGDGKAFTVIFSEYIAELGPNIGAGHANKKCKLTIDLRVPQGWSYSLFTFGYAGYGYLDVGVKGTQTSQYYFQANPGNRATFVSNFSGPFHDDFNFTDVIALSQVVWSECNRNRALIVDTELNLGYENEGDQTNGMKEGLLTLDSIDGEIKHIYGIQWQQC